MRVDREFVGLSATDSVPTNAIGPRASGPEAHPILLGTPNADRLGERTVGEDGLVVGEAGLAPHLGGVGLAPGVPAVRVGREVERLAGRMDGLRRVRPTSS